MSNPGKCPFHHVAGGGTSNRDWWPNQLRVDLLNQHSEKSNPLGEQFNYTFSLRRKGDPIRIKGSHDAALAKKIVNG